MTIAASRKAGLGSTVATIGFPNIGLQGFAPKVLTHGHGRNRGDGLPDAGFASRWKVISCESNSNYR
jgi:hypothetical protein